jgi:hypothetical protein
MITAAAVIAAAILVSGTEETYDDGGLGTS